MSFEVGTRVSDYEILGVLGAGGMGKVYRVRNVISDRMEAMKVLLPDLAAEPDLASRFIGEIRTLASFDHPNIAQLHTAFQYENQLVMIMEFVEGVTLDQRTRGGSVPLDEILGDVMQVLSALSYAHGRGVIHRDIKPANMMVTPHGIVKLMDFGIAKSLTEPQLTRPGTTMGSLFYMSPEQVRGTTVDARSDIYSVGVALYELTAGRRPFNADSTYGLLEQQLNAAPQPPIEINPSLPASLNEIILTALAKEPMHRFQSADAFRNALQSVRASLGAAQAPTEQAPSPGFIPAYAPPPGAAPAQQTRSNRGVWMAIGALVVVIVLAGAAFVLPRWLKARAAGDAAAAAVQSAASSTTPGAAAPSAASSTPQDTPSAVLSSPAQNAPDNGAGGVAASNAGSSSPTSTSTMSSSPTSASPASQGNVVQTGASQTGASHAARPAGQNGARENVRRASGPAAQQAVVVTQAPAQSAAQAPSQSANPPSAPAVSQAELNKLNDEMVQLGSRANAVKSTVENLRRQQEASGYGLRQDIAASLSRMETYMDAADHSLQTGNAAAARHNMDMADKEIGRLEQFTGR